MGSSNSSVHIKYREHLTNRLGRLDILGPRIFLLRQFQQKQMIETAAIPAVPAHANGLQCRAKRRSTQRFNPPPPPLGQRDT